MKMERAFHQDEINFVNDELRQLNQEHDGRWKTMMSSLSRFDGLWLYIYMSNGGEKQLSETQERNQTTMHRLKKERFGNLNGQYSNIFNLAGLELSKLEKEVLSRGLKFGIPQRVSREEIQAEFEVLHQQLRQHMPVSKEAADSCGVKLAGIAESFHACRDSREGFPLRKKTLRQLRH